MPAQRRPQQEAPKSQEAALQEQSCTTARREVAARSQSDPGKESTLGKSDDTGQDKITLGLTGSQALGLNQQIQWPVVQVGTPARAIARRSTRHIPLPAISWAGLAMRRALRARWLAHLTRLRRARLHSVRFFRRRCKCWKDSNRGRQEEGCASNLETPKGHHVRHPLGLVRLQMVPTPLTRNADPTIKL